MITTRREVNIENVTTDTVKRITPDNTVQINSEVEVRPFSEVSAVDTKKTAYTITPHMDMSDLMPVIKSDDVVEEEHETPRALERKTKMALCIYLATALIIALIVLVTGAAITNTSGEVAMLEQQILAQSNVLSEQNAQITYLSDELTIEQSAGELGMVKGNGATEIEMLSLSEQTNYEARTNAFDGFCDFISSIFGG